MVFHWENTLCSTLCNNQLHTLKFWSVFKILFKILLSFLLYVNLYCDRNNRRRFRYELHSEKITTSELMVWRKITARMALSLFKKPPWLEHYWFDGVMFYVKQPHTRCRVTKRGGGEGSLERAVLPSGYFPLVDRRMDLGGPVIVIIIPFCKQLCWPRKW